MTLVRSRADLAYSRAHPAVYVLGPLRYFPLIGHWGDSHRGSRLLAKVEPYFHRRPDCSSLAAEVGVQESSILIGVDTQQLV